MISAAMETTCHTLAIDSELSRGSSFSLILHLAQDSEAKLGLLQ